ncbi:MAG: hypothetical protein PHN76_05955 [Advenella sp.]|uniref:hypothetical protein n=1 Tax=Advenella sp. TaxID=1872388 RepID=UPI00258DD4C2|nr:hypothetical protein [Advenella sp.]MDD3757690.1 hypothetical protein [Advenella sp.]
MKRIEYIDIRLQQWAEWLLASATGSYRGVSFEYRPPEEHRSSTCGFDSLDKSCMEMDMAVASLPVDLKKLVIAVYLWEGGLEHVVRFFKITRTTVRRRLCHADLRIQEYLDAKQQRAKEIARHCKNNFATYP